MIINKYQHPVLFYILSTILSWTCWFIAGYISHITPGNNTLTLVMGGLAFLGLIAPNIVALLLILPDQELRRDMLGRFFNFKGVKVKYWLAACFFMLGSILLAQAVSLSFGYSATQFKLAGSFSFTSGVFPVWLLLIAAPFLEELAWHSYGTDCLRSRFSLFTTSIIFALYWGIWHFPLSTIKDYYHSNLVESGLIYSLNFFISIIPFVLIMNWLYYKTDRNILIAVIFHITAGYFNEIFQTHPMSKVIQTVLLLIFSVYLILKEKDFFFKKLTKTVFGQSLNKNKNQNHRKVNIMRNLLITLFTIVFCTVSYSQTITQTVRGKVYDNLTKEPLPGTNIIVLDTDPCIGTTSDLDGNFILEKVPVGRQNIQVIMMGYESYIVNELLISSGQQPVLDVALQQAILETDAVVVTINKDIPLNTMTTVSSRQFTVEETQRYAGGIDDPARLASSFAGVATPSVVSNGISVRGNNPDGLLWRIEGVEVPNPNHFADLTVVGGGLLTALSSQMMGNSDFYTGAFPAEYGNAASGVFDINLKTGNSNKREYALQAGLIGVDFSTQGPFVMGKDASYIMNYRNSTMALISPLLPEDTGILKYQDFSFKTNFPTKKAGVFSLWGIGALDGQEMDAADSIDWEANSDRDNSQTELYMYATGLSHKMVLNSSTFLNSTLSATGNGLSHKEQRLNYSLQPIPRSHIDNNTWRYTIQSSIGKRFSNMHSNQTGFYYSQLGYDVDIEQSQAEGETPVTLAKQNGQSGLLQLYTQSKITPVPGLSLNIGVHAQYLFLNDKYSIEPRAGVKYDINDKHSLAFAYGLHSRIERLPIYFVDVDGSNPNKNLDLLKSTHYVLAYNVKLNDNLRLCIEPYYQKLTNIPVSPNSYVSTINMQNDVFFNEALVSKGSGRNIGVDLTIERFLSDGFYYLATASIFDSKYTAADGITRNTRFNKNYVFNLLAGKEWTVGKNKDNILSANIRLNYLGGNRKDAIDEQASIIEKEVVYGETGGYAFNKKYQDVPVFSLTVSYRTNKAKYSSVWSLQILNLTSAQEYSNDIYSLKTGKVKTNYEGIMVPNLSYRIEF
jgi:membrane protease YdiL (CAAX protease family)